VKRLRGLPIRHKLLALGMLGSTLALVGTAVAFGVYDWLTFRQGLARSLTVQAKIMAASCQWPVIFRDHRTAAGALGALSVEPGILGAAVYTADGARLATYAAPGFDGLPDSARALPPGIGARFEPDRLLVRIPILGENGSRVGTLALLSDLEEESRRLERYAGIVAVVLLLSVGLVYLITWRVQRLVSDPILSLAGTAEKISRSSDFSVRAASGNSDEVGTLIDAFNAMLGQIQRRDVALQQARDELEHRVRERTEELGRKVAELESTEAELRRLAARLEVSNRELQDFASVASHDLQEPLRKIQAFGSRLVSRLGDRLDPESGDYLARMQSATARMQTLIDDLLALSRISTMPRAVSATRLDDVVRDVLTDLETRIEATGAEVSLSPLPTIQADATHMRQLFQNLLGNALKFVRPGVPPRIRVAAERAGNGCGSRAWCISVQDNGIGFDEKYLDRIFTVFQRLQGRAAYEGTGIGLAICRRIVERHGGSITARSTPGEGSTFFVTLPARSQEGVDLGQHAADHHPSGR
jgi:signal transduction histidine kinase